MDRSGKSGLTIARRLLAVLPCALAVLVVMGGGTTACADGMFAPKISYLGKAGTAVASGRQEALLMLEGGRVQITLRTHFDAGPKELAWIIPVPKKPEQIEEGEEGVFQSLEALTTPNFTHWSKRRGFGCSSGASAETVGRLVVHETGKAGIFDYTVLRATAADELAQWLRQHRYQLPANSAEVLKHYVDAGWYWLAIQVNAVAQEQRTLAPPPIRFAYRDKQVVYPLLISRLSAGKQNEVLLYVLANARYAATNWENRIVPSSQLLLDRRSPSGTNYEKLFQQQVNIERGHVFVTEAAYAIQYDRRGSLSPAAISYDGQLRSGATRGYLTRLRTVIPPEAMDRDVLLSRASSDDVLNHHQVRDSVSATSSAQAIALPGTLCIVWLVFAIFRPRLSKRAFR